MPQFPSWKLPTAAWTDAMGAHTAQLRDALADLASRGRDATDGMTTRTTDLVGRTRDRCEAAPRALVGEFRRRVNVLDLATKQDVEAQTRMARNRMSHVLKQFLEEQRGHEQQLLEALRTELHEELQSFAAAIDDDLFAVEVDTASVAKRSSALEFLDEEDDDEFDLDEYEALDDEFDISDDGTMIRQSLLDAADG